MQEDNDFASVLSFIHSKIPTGPRRGPHSEEEKVVPLSSSILFFLFRIYIEDAGYVMRKPFSHSADS